MAVTIENLQVVEGKVMELRALVSKRSVADAGAYQYMNPVTGAMETAAVPDPEKTAVVDAYKAALSALKAAVQALTE